MTDFHFHDIEGKFARDGYGAAVTHVDERLDGTLWVGNGEYATQANFCPVCGFKARVQVIEKPWGELS